jgi:hypothetical protein
LIGRRDLLRRGLHRGITAFIVQNRCQREPETLFREKQRGLKAEDMMERNLV